MACLTLLHIHFFILGSVVDNFESRIGRRYFFSSYILCILSRPTFRVSSFHLSRGTSFPKQDEIFRMDTLRHKSTFDTSAFIRRPLQRSSSALDTPSTTVPRLFADIALRQSQKNHANVEFEPAVLSSLFSSIGGGTVENLCTPPSSTFFHLLLSSFQTFSSTDLLASAKFFRSTLQKILDVDPLMF